MKKLTTEEFIKKARKVHGDRYDYSKAKYVDSKTEIVIICPVHGEFKQRPDNHVNGGKGCPECGRLKTIQKQRFSQEEWMAAVAKGNPNIEILEEVVNSKTPALCVCKICNHKWKAIPENIRRGEGCPECDKLKRIKNQTLTHEEQVIAIAEKNPDVEVLGKIVGSTTKVSCLCKICNYIWPVSPDNLKHGKGCPRCAESGFKNSRESCLYLLVDDLELPTCIKVGVSNNFDKRFAELTHHTPFPVHVLKVFTFEAGCATFELEQFAHTIFADRNCHFEGFDGCTEWFWYSHEIVDFLEENC